MEDQALIPIAQIDTTIAGFPITGVLLPDNQAGGVFAMFCQALDLHTQRQLQRLHRDPELVDALVLVSVNTPGGPQPTNVIYSWAVPLWLARIRAGARPPAYQERLRTIRRQTFHALENLFKQTGSSSPTGSAPQAAPPPPPAALPAPAVTATTIWDDWHRLIDRMRLENSDVRSQLTLLQEDQHAHDLRLGALESAHARPNVGLSPQRTAHLVFLARQLRERRGTPLDSVLAALAARFQIETAFDLPDAAWPAILAWFDGLLGA